jgi:CIC family chloride channel protein
VTPLRDLARPAQRQSLGLVALAALIGILGALGNLAFRAVIAGSAWVFQERVGSPFGRAGIPLALLAGGMVLLLLDRLFPDEVLGYGFPRFLEVLHLKGAVVKRRWIVVKTLASGISLGAGAAVGREGPIAQIDGAVGGAIARLVRLPAEQRKVLIACGAAAGIATTFNAPIGALMFAHEIVLLGELHLANFSLILVATTVAVIASRGLFANEAVFLVPAFRMESYWECLSYVLLGVILGLLAVAYVRLFHALARGIRRLAWPRAAVLLGGLALVGLLDVALPQNVSDGYPVVNQALAGDLGWQRMAALSAAKIVGSSLSLGCGAPGGVFGPIFFIGAMTGGAFRSLSAVLLPGLTGPRGSYALVGLGAFLAATTHAPLTAIFLLFEMTQSYLIAIPALISAGIALMIAAAIEPESIDTLGLTAEGKSLHPRAEGDMLGGIPIAGIYRREVDTLAERTPLPELLRRVGASRQASFPVVDEGGAMVGILSFAALRALVSEESLADLIVAADIADPNVITLTPEESLAAAFRVMESEGLEDVPVVDGADPHRLLGMLSRADLIAAYNRTVAALSALPVSAWLTTGGVRSSGEYQVTVLPVPRGWVGRSLREVDCRARYGVTVVAVQQERTDGQAYVFPDPERPLAAGDQIVLAGAPDALRRVRAS